MSSAPPPTTLPDHVISQILSYLSLPSATTLPSSPLVFLRAHFASLPATILQHFAEPVTSPRERSSIPEIKAKRLIWANGGNAPTGMGMAPRRVSISQDNAAEGSYPEPPPFLGNKPAELEWNAGRKRWPALWERLGGPVDPLEIDRLSREYPPRRRGSSSTSSSTVDDSSFAMNSFLPSDVTAHHTSQVPSNGVVVGDSARSGMNTTMDRRRFGAFLRALEEEREAMDDVAARRLERDFDRREEANKEEFDSESDEELFETGENGIHLEHGAIARKQQINDSTNSEVIEMFERRLLELFVDGLDTIPYAPIDFADPAYLPPNPLTIQDHEDAYFDDEEEGIAPPLGDEPIDRIQSQLGEGEYDY